MFQSNTLSSVYIDEHALIQRPMDNNYIENLTLKALVI